MAPSHLHLDLSSGLFPLRFGTKILSAFLDSPVLYIRFENVTLI